MMHGQPPLGCLHEQKAQGGAVDRHGQRSVYDTHGPIRSIMLQICQRFQQIRHAYNIIQVALNLEIWRFSC